jgi:hypothetical protein
MKNTNEKIKSAFTFESMIEEKENVYKPKNK